MRGDLYCKRRLLWREELALVDYNNHFRTNPSPQPSPTRGEGDSLVLTVTVH
jgi:hypothetical protein